MGKPIRLILTALCAALLALPVHAAEGSFGIGLRQPSWVDAARGIKKTMGFEGAETRRLDVMVWYPAAVPGDDAAADAPLAAGGPWPLVIYSHGTNGRPDNALHIVKDLVRRGYVVAAPNYPLSSSSAFTRIRMTDTSDVINQVKDVRFVIDRLLADPFFGPAIDAQKIGITGHSLGGVTSYFATYGAGLRDPRVKAAALIAPGDPVQTVLSNGMGLWGTQHAAVPVPVLFLTAEKDVFARTTGRPYAAYARVEGPKFQVMIKRGVHVWFNDGHEQPAGNKNPDCLWFERHIPSMVMPGCEERVPLIGPARQQAISRTALHSFFDGYLKGDAGAIRRLKAMGGKDKDVNVHFEER